MSWYWEALIQEAQRISIYRSPGMEYNEERCRHYVVNQAGNAIDAYIQITGVDAFLHDLHHRGTQRNPKYDRLVSEYKAFLL